MGNSYSTKNFSYGVYVGEKKEGETQILRHPEIGDKEIHTINHFGVQTTWDTILNNIKLGKGDKEMCGYRKRLENNTYEKKFTWITYNQAKEMCESFAKGVKLLNLLDISHSDKDGDFKFMGIYSRNRYQWIIAYLGSHCNSVTPVPIYDTLGEKAIEHILNQTKLKTIVIEPKGFKKIIKLAKEKKIGNLSNLITIEEEDDLESIKEFKELGINVYKFDEIIEKGRKEGKEIELSPCKPDDIAIVCYTSGTTGIPKGAMMPQKNLLVETEVIHAAGFYVRATDVYFSFLPYAHIMECLIITVLLVNGRPFGIFSGDLKLFLEDLKILKPTALCAVPRIFQRMYDGIISEIKKQGEFIEKLFYKGVEMKIKDFKKTGNIYNIFWDNLIFNKVKKTFGGRIRFMLVGSAPTDPYILNFLRITLNCHIIEGYGGTEGCAGTHLSNMYDNYENHVGGVGYAAEYKLVDIPELGYTCNDIDPDTQELRPRGEICVRGPIIFKGYYDDEENTKKAIDDEGFLHTGDIGMIIPSHGNCLRVIDRVKNIFKLQQGEYVAPEKLENVLIKDKYIEQIFVYGDSLKNYLVAVVVPNANEVINYLKSKNIDATRDNYKNYFDNEDLKNEILKSLEKLGRSSDFKGFEIIKKIYLSPEPFTIENDLMTTTLKLKRHIAKKYFKNQLESMYSN
jgi:long-chain acyl-CoA synthetase